MKKLSTILFFILIFSASSGTLRVFAEVAQPTPTTINARILPTIWYSTLSVNEAESIKIYAGIQNNSGTDFTGTATFFMDDKEISKSQFSSPADSLKDVSASWVASLGNHNVQVKISTSLPTDKILVSYDSDKSTITITKKTTPITLDTAKATVLATASDIVAKADDIASTLADKIDSLKKPIISALSATATATPTEPKRKGSVLGASVSPTVKANNSDITKNSPIDLILNFCLGILSFLVKNWKWTLVGIIVLFLLLKIMGKKKVRRND